MSTLALMLAFFTQLSLLVTCTYLLGMLRPRLQSLPTPLRKILDGSLFGVFALLVMVNPIQIADGVFFDLRNVIIAVAGAFGGGVPAALVSLLVIIYRLSLGGAGLPVALGSALTSAALGLGLYLYRQHRALRNELWLIPLGLVVALQTLAWTFVLPANTAQQTLLAIGLPILIAYPVSSWLFGFLLLSQERHRDLEAELSKERSLLRTLIDTIPANVYIKDTESRFIDANTKTARVFGHKTRHELIGKTDFDFFPTELAAKYRADEQTVFQSGLPLLNIEEVTVDLRTGQQHWLLTTKAPILKARNEVAGLVGVGLDITERKRAEEALRQSEAKAQAVLTALPDLMFMVRRDGTIVDYKAPETADLYVPRDEIIGKTIRELMPLPLAEVLAQRIALTLDTDTVQRYEYALPTAQGIGYYEARFAKCGEDEVVSLVRNVTDQTHTQEQIVRERDLLRTLIDHLPDYIFVKDAEGRFVNSNTAHNQIAHVQRADELRGKSVFEIFPADLAAQFYADDQQVLQSGQALVNVERTTQDGLGQPRTVLTTKVPLLDASGTVTGLVGISRDISERKQAEQALQAKAEAEHHFQLALKALYEITIELTQIDSLDDFYRRTVELARERLGFDRFGLLLYDAEHSRLVGTYGTDAQGNLVAERKLQFDPATLTDMLKRTLETSEHFALDEHAQLSSNREPIGFGWNAVALLRNGRQTFGWLAADNAVQHQPVSQALLDILVLYAQTVGTLLGRKRAEQTLRENEAKLETFFEVLPVGVSVVNDEGQIVEMNPALARILDISMEGLQNGAYHARKYIANDGSPMERREFPSARVRLERRAVHDVVIGVLKEDGTTIWTSVSSAPLPGTDAAVITVTADITERKRAETQAFALAAEQQRVKLLGDFIADVSHDFRTPLTLIGTSAYLIGKTTDPVKLTRHSQRIEEQMTRLRLLLDNFVQLADLEQQASLLQLQPTDLNEIIRTILERTQQEIAGKHQQLDYRCETPSVRVVGDSQALSQAITQVVLNALHYTPDEGKIMLRLYHEGENAVVEVADTGMGIPAADLPHIFESFYRVDSARSTESGGAGLGLSIAKRIVELMKGKIAVDSEVGAGSVFRIYLPIYP